MNRHAAIDETTSRSHHELLDQIGQLGHRERVLIGENVQLRAQLVEMKEQEKKKYDDLMVQYNMKREHEDDGLDNQGTSNNQVTVKTEWNDEEVKQEIKEEDEEDRDIFIKREYVPVYIKTELNDEDVKEIIKQEIKEEYDEDDHNDDCVHELRLVKKELVSDDDANCEQLSDHSLLTEKSNGTNQVSVNDQQVDKGDHEPANNGHNQSSTSKQSKTRKRRRTNKSITTKSLLENSLTSDELGRNASSKRTRFSSVLQPRKTAEQMSSGVGLSESHNQDGIDSSGGGEEGVEQNEEEERLWDSEAELDGDEDEGGHYKIEILKLKCIEDGCEDEVADRDELNHHLRVKHHISPYRCLAVGCLERFEQCGELGLHVRYNHSNISAWPCPHCTKTFNAHNLLYQHLHLYHFEGQFKCGYGGCHNDRVATLRSEIRTHQDSVHRKTTIFTCQFHNCGKSFNKKYNFDCHQRIHTGVKSFPCDWTGCGKSFTRKGNLDAHQRIHQNVKSFPCDWTGCGKSFTRKGNLDAHKRIHQNVKPFKCTWNKCDYASTHQSHVIKHIRTKHFHLPASQKAQRQRGIEDNRNPRDYLLNTTQPI